MRRSIVIVACVALLASGCQASATPAPSATSASGPSGPTNTPGSRALIVGRGDKRGAVRERRAGSLGRGRRIRPPASSTTPSCSGTGASSSCRTILETPATSAQTWDPATNAWRPTEGLNKYRSLYVAVPMAGGLALVTGGDNENGVSFSSTYLFDPSTETWTKSGLLGTARTSPSGATLKDGRVLVAGGYFVNGGPASTIPPDAVLAAFHPGGLHDIDIPPFATAMATSEVFDPATGTWSSTGPMKYARLGASAVTLADGRVLVFGSGGGDGSGITVDGGAFDSAEIYDPATGKFSLAGTLPPYDAAAIEAKGAPNANPIPSSPAEIGPGILVALPDGGAVLIGVDYYWKHQGDLTRSFRYDAGTQLVVRDRRDVGLHR